MEVMEFSSQEEYNSYMRTLFLGQVIEPGPKADVKINLQESFTGRSLRITCVDFHPVQNWVLAASCSGDVYIYDYIIQSLVKTIGVSTSPVRSARFIPSKNWIVAASDDTYLYIYNYNTLEKMKSFEAHESYIRFMVVHPTQPLLLSCSDDKTIRCWDWENDWECTRVFKGHKGIVMQVKFNPKDDMKFVSCSTDSLIKFWSLDSPCPNFTLGGHSQAVCSVDYYSGPTKPYLISGSDDGSVKVWDYSTKSCIMTVNGQSRTLSLVGYVPDYPLAITGSHDGRIKVWETTSFREAGLISTNNGRSWCFAFLPGKDILAVGFEDGLCVMKLGDKHAKVSMDNGGKIIWAKYNTVLSTTIKDGESLEDGVVREVPPKMIGTCERRPDTLQHSPNGRFVSVCGDGEYTIYTALAWRNKQFGKATQFSWSSDSSFYAIRSEDGSVSLFQSFNHVRELAVKGDGIFGGALLGVSTDNSLLFFDWGTQRLVRGIDSTPVKVIWSDSGEFVVVVCADAFSIIRFHREAFINSLDEDEEIIAESVGIEEAFELIVTYNGWVTSGKWVGDCFVYTCNKRLSYAICKSHNTVVYLDSPYDVIGYFHDRIYLMDRTHKITSYFLPLTFLTCKQLVLDGNYDETKKLIPEIPPIYREFFATFLTKLGFLDLAFQAAIDPEQKFYLAIQMKHIPLAQSLAKTQADFQMLADLALDLWDIDLALEYFEKANDLAGLLLVYTSLSDSKGLTSLALRSIQSNNPNIALLCYIQTGDTSSIISLLKDLGRAPEAAFFARTYSSKDVSSSLNYWKAMLLDSHKSNISKSLLDPLNCPETCPKPKSCEAQPKFPQEIETYIVGVDELQSLKIKTGGLIKSIK